MKIIKFFLLGLGVIIIGLIPVIFIVIKKNETPTIDVNKLAPINITQFFKNKNDEEHNKKLMAKGVKFSKNTKFPIHKNKESLVCARNISIPQIIYSLKKCLKIPKDGSKITNFNYKQNFTPQTLWLWKDKDTNSKNLSILNSPEYKNFEITTFNIPDLIDPTKMHIKFLIKDKKYPKYYAFFKLVTLNKINPSNIKIKYGDQEKEAKAPNRIKKIIEHIANLKNSSGEFTNFKEYLKRTKIIDPVIFENFLTKLNKTEKQLDQIQATKSEGKNLYELFVASPFLDVKQIKKIFNKKYEFQLPLIERDPHENDKLEKNIYYSIHALYDYLNKDKTFSIS